jgi:uncharacterized protein YukE
MATLRRALHNFICNVFGQCIKDYNKDMDTIQSRYIKLDSRVTKLEREWRPRDLVNLR